MPPVDPTLRRLFEWPDADAPLGASAQTAIRTIQELPGLPAEEQYRLWLQHDDNRVLQALLDHPDIGTDPTLATVACEAWEEESRHILQAEICSSERFWLLANLGRVVAASGALGIGDALHVSDDSAIAQAFARLRGWITHQDPADLPQVLAAAPRPEIAHMLAHNARLIPTSLFYHLLDHHAALAPLIKRRELGPGRLHHIYDRALAALVKPSTWLDLPPIINFTTPYALLRELADHVVDEEKLSGLDSPLEALEMLGSDLADAAALVPMLGDEAGDVHEQILLFVNDLPRDVGDSILGNYSAIKRPDAFRRFVEEVDEVFPDMFERSFQHAPDALIDALDQETLAAWLSHPDPEFRRATLLHILPRTRIQHADPKTRVAPISPTTPQR